MRTKDLSVPRERVAHFATHYSRVWRASLYDVATEHHGRFLRVQVKCTIFHRGNSYKCHLDSNRVPYSARDLDFIAALVIPTDTWYILPIRATNGQPDILLSPQSPRAKNEKYKEAWHLLKR